MRHNQSEMRHTMAEQKAEELNKTVEGLAMKTEALEAKGNEHDWCFYIGSFTLICLVAYLGTHDFY